MNQCVQDVFSGRMNTPYYLDSPFVDERARYLAQLLERGWARETVIGTAGRLAGFAMRVDITAAGSVTAAQIEAAADEWMNQQPHYFRQPIGPHRSRRRFVNVARDWLAPLGRLNEPECVAAPHADLLTEFTGLIRSAASHRPPSEDAVVMPLVFSRGLTNNTAPLSGVTILDVERYLALPRTRPWSRVTVAGCVASRRSFFRYAGARKWCTPNIGEAIDAPRLYTLAGLPAGPSWIQVRQLIARHWAEAAG